MGTRDGATSGKLETGQLGAIARLKVQWPWAMAIVAIVAIPSRRCCISAESVLKSVTVLSVQCVRTGALTIVALWGSACVYHGLVGNAPVVTDLWGTAQGIT